MRSPGVVAAVAMTVVLVGGCTTTPAPGSLTEEQTRFVAEVGPLDVHLADPRTAVKLGESICADLRGGLPPEQVAIKAQRFTGGEVAMDLDKTTRVVTSARTHLCT